MSDIFGAIYGGGGKPGAMLAGKGFSGGAAATSAPGAAGAASRKGDTLAMREMEYWAEREKGWASQAAASRAANEASAKEHAAKLIDYQNEVAVRRVEITTAGFEKERQLETLRFTQETAALAGQNDLIELAREKHSLNMTAIAQNEAQQMIAKSAQFGNFWGDMLVGVVEQAGNSFNNVARLFGQMIKKMAIKAAVSGFLGYLIGGPAGGAAAAKASLGIPAMATGGMVYKPTLAVVGENGPERVLNPAETRAYNKGAVYNDNSSITITIGEGARGMDVNGIAEAVDRVIRERKSSEFENFRRKMAG